MAAVSQICAFPGNQDLYGAGIRIGLYLQWIATLLVTIFDQKEEQTLRVVNLLVQSAIFLGLCIIPSPQIHPIEPVITLWLLVGALSSLTGDGLSYFAHFSGAFRVAFYTALSTYSCWFWFVGIESMLQPECKVVAFFGGTAIDGRFRTFSKVVSVGSLAVCVCCFGFVFWAMLQRCKNTKGIHERIGSPAPRVELSLLFLSLGLIVVSIVAIEYLIKANSISGTNEVESVGQLIPLLVGALGCGMICWRILKKFLFRRKRCWFLFGYHL
ncbi:uncharacterized protein BDR25DRAFT_276513 [Lindgomyces ingoldianus]|uniref:Uncharacterized protein n=1 Tax=Lindgomyces ingoldianus TaxID=673940 RepID=A0ACB6RF18_9PLEO|nr:uncharacterized protein BDR25DRAFT_276513 [Lindgomyces ingoldianus]KAF2476915.1 hypothetical protein BDR25DRAFT_276513 [Lindgomyces ingoldianus]